MWLYDGFTGGSKNFMEKLTILHFFNFKAVLEQTDWLDSPIKNWT